MNTSKGWDKVSQKYILQKFSPRIRRNFETCISIINYDTLKSLRKGGWLLINGEQGTGKTMLAAGYMLASMKASYMSYEADYLISNHLFTTSIDMLDDIRKGMTEGNEKEIVDKYNKACFLVIDDLGAEKLTDWSFATLYRLVNYRYENLLTTIFTTPYTGAELLNKLDDRIVFRIGEMSKVINMKKVYRRQP